MRAWLWCLTPDHVALFAKWCYVVYFTVIKGRAHSEKKILCPKWNTRHDAAKYELYFICDCRVDSMERHFSYVAAVSFFVKWTPQ